MNHLFAWYELMTTDLDAAAGFYGKVLGWQAMPAPGAPAGMDYRLLALPGAPPSAGLMALPEAARAMGVPPNWLGYVAVESAAAALAKAVALGATAVVPVTEIPEMCRFACIMDPQGAALGFMEPINPPPDAKPDYMAVGRVGWHELYAADLDAALAFYGALFGWEKQQSIDMGPMGIYQMYGLGETMLGGMMKKPPMMPQAAWGYYANVADIDVALAASNGNGGKLFHGPQQVPGGSWVVNCQDPQGAVFSMVGARKG
jgi:predicted enzyme related to lactoylglutathione lyase